MKLKTKKEAIYHLLISVSVPEIWPFKVSEILRKNAKRKLSILCPFSENCDVTTRIRFKPKIREDKIDFLDTMVTIENGYLITSPYSKSTDSKQYLVPSSVHKENVVNNIPKTVGMRLRRLCSDRVEGDRIFADALDEYRAYMEARGYDPMSIRGHFAEIANLKRQDALKKVKRREKKWKERPIFLLNSKNLLFQV